MYIVVCYVIQMQCLVAAGEFYGMAVTLYLLDVVVVAVLVLGLVLEAEVAVVVIVAVVSVF